MYTSRIVRFRNGMELIFVTSLSIIYTGNAYHHHHASPYTLEILYRRVRSWPSNIFQLCVCDRPSATNIREVVAFFYGNGPSFRYASFFYLICNERGSALTTTPMFTFYSLWHSDKTTSHHAQHYNMKHKIFMWIKGSGHPQLEPVVSPEKSNITFGVDGAEGADVIHENLISLKDV